MTTRAWGATAGAVALALVAGCGTERKPAPPVAAAPQVEGVRASGQVTVRATVVAVDRKRRVVTLRGPEGDEVTVTVGPQVKNFAEIRRGDDVTATYYEAVALRLRKPDGAQPGIASADEIAAARPGDMPAGVAVQATTITATIAGVDAKRRTVTLRGPRGRTRTVRVPDPDALAAVTVGDVVQVTYTEAVAVAVEKPTR